MIAVALAVAVCALLLAGWALVQVRASEARLASIIGDDGGGPRQVARDIAAARTELAAAHGRAESRTYAKSVEAGASSSELTPEEKQAVAAARAGEGNAR